MRRLTKKIIKKIEWVTLTCQSCQHFKSIDYKKADGAHLLLGGCTRFHQPTRAEDKACVVYMKGEQL